MTTQKYVPPHLRSQFQKGIENSKQLFKDLHRSVGKLYEALNIKTQSEIELRSLRSLVFLVSDSLEDKEQARSLRYISVYAQELYRELKENEQKSRSMVLESRECRTIEEFSVTIRRIFKQMKKEKVRECLQPYLDGERHHPIISFRRCQNGTNYTHEMIRKEYSQPPLILV